MKPTDFKLFDQDYELQEAQLPFIISISAKTNFGDGNERRIKLSGHTRSVGAGELELVGPFILFNNRSILGKDATLRVTLGLPGGSISLQAVTHSYTQLDESEMGMGYLITAHDELLNNAADLNCVVRARITNINESDRLKLVRYLRGLRQASSEQTVMVLDGNGMWREQVLTVTVVA